MTIPAVLLRENGLGTIIGPRIHLLGICSMCCRIDRYPKRSKVICSIVRPFCNSLKAKLMGEQRQDEGATGTNESRHH